MCVTFWGIISTRFVFFYVSVSSNHVIPTEWIMISSHLTSGTFVEYIYLHLPMAFFPNSRCASSLRCLLKLILMAVSAITYCQLSQQLLTVLRTYGVNYHYRSVSTVSKFIPCRRSMLCRHSFTQYVVIIHALLLLPVDVLLLMYCPRLLKSPPPSTRQRPLIFDVERPS